MEIWYHSKNQLYKQKLKNYGLVNVINYHKMYQNCWWVSLVLDGLHESEQIATWKKVNLANFRFPHFVPKICLFDLFLFQELVDFILLVLQY